MLGHSRPTRSDLQQAFRVVLAGLLGVLAASAQSPGYIGAGGCASSNCHGATTPAPVSQSRILGNEYSIWSVRDKHSQAYSVLSNERSKRMAEIAGVGDPTKAEACLSCHAVGSTEKFMSDGVSCEACHGPAEKWLGPHTAADNSHANNVSLGMDDTKDLAVRAAKCLGCHIGGKGRRVDHALIAAGHPDLVFELDTFSAALPRHWRAPEGETGNTLPSLRALAVGQAMALAEGMRQLAADAGSAAWPEFVHLECYQCHHDLRRDSWRIARGYGGRKPGGLLLNVSRFVVLEAAARQAGGGSAARLSGSLETLSEAIAGKLGDGDAVAEEARAIAAQAEALAGRFATHDFTSAAASGMARALDADIRRISNFGVNAAEQAVMALDAIAAAQGIEEAEQQIGGLYDYLEHPSTYRPAEFAKRFRAAAGLIR